VALCAPSKNRRLACEANTSSSAPAGNIQIRINSGNAWVCVAKKGGLVAALRTSVTHTPTYAGGNENVGALKEKRNWHSLVGRDDPILELSPTSEEASVAERPVVLPPSKEQGAWTCRAWRYCPSTLLLQ